MKKRLKLSNGTVIKLLAWGYNTTEIPRKHGVSGFLIRYDSIDFSVSVTRKHGIEFYVKFSEVSLDNKSSLMEYANDQLTMAVFLDN